jgi:PAS domain S-box-containing protein
MERFRYIFEASNVGKSITMPDGRLNTNRAFADFLGYTTEELKEVKWQDITPSEDIEAIEKITKSLLAGDKDSARFEKRYIHKSGKILWADVSVAMRRDAKGNPLYFISTIVDISNRKLAEEALRNSEEYQRAMISCSPVALYSTDTGGIVLSWNISAQKIFGWSAEEVIGKPLPIVPEDRINEYHTLRRIVLEEGPFTGKELLHIKKDGTLFTVKLSVAPIRNDKGKIIGIFSAAEDITEKKKNEAEQKSSGLSFYRPKKWNLWDVWRGCCP